MVASSLRRWPAFIHPHPCGNCGKLIERKTSRKYCSHKCYVVKAKGRLPWNTGRKLNEHQRAAISHALLGNKYRLGIPHTAETKAKMSLHRLGRHKSEVGRLNMKRAAIVAGALGRKSTTLGQKFSAERRRRMSEAAQRTYVQGRNISQPIRCTFSDRKGRTFKFRSTWELRVAKELDRRLLDWDYETKRIVLSTGRTYLPDFWIADWNYFLEVKGIWRKNPLTKVHQARLDGHDIVVVANVDRWLKLLPRMAA